MPFPLPATGVPREFVGTRVKAMLQNLDVGDVECTEQVDGQYTIIPRPRSRGLSILADAEAPAAPKARAAKSRAAKSNAAKSNAPKARTPKTRLRKSGPRKAR